MSVSVCDAILLPLLSVVLFTLSDDKCRQTSKQIIPNANAQCERAPTKIVTGVCYTLVARREGKCQL